MSAKMAWVLVKDFPMAMNTVSSTKANVSSFSASQFLLGVTTSTRFKLYIIYSIIEIALTYAIGDRKPV
jgi:hypothetical protein